MYNPLSSSRGAPHGLAAARAREDALPLQGRGIIRCSIIMIIIISSSSCSCSSSSNNISIISSII